MPGNSTTSSPCAGSGYLTGAFGLLVGDSGQVLGVEQHAELAERSRGSLQQAVPDLMKVSHPSNPDIDLADSEERVWGIIVAWLLHQLRPGCIAAGCKGSTEA